MAYEGAGEKRDADLRERRGTVLPLAAVESIHESRGTGNDADRQAASYDLPIGRKIRANVEVGLRSARLHSETRNHFVEHQSRADLLGYPAELVEKLPGLEVEAAALH